MRIFFTTHVLLLLERLSFLEITYVGKFGQAL